MSIDVEKELVAALREIAAHDGKCLGSDHENEHHRRGYRLGSHFAFDKAARIAKAALAKVDAP